MSAQRPLYLQLGIALLTLTLCAQVSLARPRDPSAGPAGRIVERQLRKHLVPPHIVMRHMDELELSEAQRQQFRELMKGVRGQMKGLRAELKTASKALIDAVRDQSSAEAEVLKLADKLTTLEARHKRARLKTALKVRALLSPAQLETAKSIKTKDLAERKERRGERRRRRALRQDKQGARAAKRAAKREAQD